MSQPRCEVIGDCTLYCGDSLELLDQFDTRWAVVSDVPYGMQFDYTTLRGGRQPAGSPVGRRVRAKQWPRNIQGDATAFDPTPWLPFAQVILWGANHFASRLPERNSWLVWDKRVGVLVNDFSDAELAWTNLAQPIRIYRQLWAGILRGASAENGQALVHPAQKPLGLCQWCVAMTTGTVLDPYAGSFTIAAACVRLGRPCVSVEIDPAFFDLGCRRIEAAYRQPDLFLEQAKRQAPTQEPLFAKETPCS